MLLSCSQSPQCCCLLLVDLDGLRTQSLEGARMGYTGKQVIHPIQVPVVQEAFTPAPHRVEWATELIKAFDEHQESGKVRFRGLVTCRKYWRVCQHIPFFYSTSNGLYAKHKNASPTWSIEVMHCLKCWRVTALLLTSDTFWWRVAFVQWLTAA